MALLPYVTQLAMEVILLSDVEKVGLRGEVVDVARGYARNFLLPRRLAEEATPGRVAELRRREAKRGRQEARNSDQAQEIAEVLGKTVLRFEVKAGPTGALFGSVTPTDIADEIWRARKVRVDRRKIDLDEPIKRIGRYEVPIAVFEERRRRGQDPRRARGRRAAARGGARGDGRRRGSDAAAEEEATEGDAAWTDLEAAVEELEAAEAEAGGGRGGAEPRPSAEAQAEQVPDDAFDRAVDEPWNRRACNKTATSPSTGGSTACGQPAERSRS